MKKALIVWGGWEGHEPKQCADIFAPVLQAKGFEVEVSDTLDAYLDKEKMEPSSLIVPVWTMGTITREQEDGLLEAVQGGVGIAGWHGGMGDSFRNNTDYQFMVGGQWVAHPGGIIDYTVNITDHTDPITRGHERLQDALRAVLHARRPGQRGAGDDDLQHPDVSVDRRHGDAGGLEAHVGQGRVFYTSLGHVAKDFEEAEAQEIQIRGMLWAAR